MAISTTHKKWRLLRSYASCLQVLFRLHFLAKKKIEPHRRWRLAFLTIYCSRVMISVGREIVARKIHLQRSPSHSVIDMPSSFCFPFNLDPEKLKLLVKKKNFNSLQQLGGVQAVVRALESHAEAGVRGDPDDLCRRGEAFGTNEHQKVSADSLCRSLLKPFKDISQYVIIVFAIITLVHGINQYGWTSGWQEGGCVLLFPLVYSSVSYLIGLCVKMYFQKSCEVTKKFKFKTLINCASSIEVSRNGIRQPILISEIVAGDIIHLKSGDIIPADGLFLEGEFLKVDETSFSNTGKHGTDDDQVVKSNSNPFLFSYSKVIDGQARMLVTAVGKNTTWAEKTMINCSMENNSTPLQARIHKLRFPMLTIALVVASLVMLVMFARYFSGNYRGEDVKKEFLGTDKTALDILFAVCRMVLASSVALYMVDIGVFFQGINIALAHSTNRMRTNNVFIHKLSACEMMGLVTTIIADEVGSLKLKEFEVPKFCLGGQSARDGSCLSVTPFVLELFLQGIGLNTSGSPMERELLSWAMLELNLNVEELKHNAVVQHVEAINSENEESRALVWKDNSIHMHWRGSAEVILSMCSSYYDASGIKQDVDDGERNKLEEIVHGMASSNFHCLAFAHTELEEEDIREDGIDIDAKIRAKGLTLIGFVSVRGPCQQIVAEAIAECQEAGVNIKLVTCESTSIARATATDCGLLEPNDNINGEHVIEGENFRRYTPEEKMEKSDGICVMADSSPSDKVDMVQCLKQKGHMIGVLRDGTNDTTTKEGANVSLSMWMQGNESTNQTADITITNGNFASVVMVMRWGRCILNNTQKLIQFQLTSIIVSAINEIIPLLTWNESPYLDTRLGYALVQIIWVNLFLGMFAAWVLGMELPEKEVLHKPVGQTSQPVLITNIMWRNIAAQVVHQILISQILQFFGQSLFGVSDKGNNSMVFVFSTFSQVFNLFNSRRLEKKNIFEGVLENRCLLGIVAVSFPLELLLVEVLQNIVSMERLAVTKWIVCIALAFLSWPVGLVIKFVAVPDKPFQRYLHQYWLCLKSFFT